MVRNCAWEDVWNGQELCMGGFLEWSGIIQERSGIMHGRMSRMVRNCAWEDFWNGQESFRNDQELCMGGCLEWSGIIQEQSGIVIRTFPMPLNSLKKLMVKATRRKD